MKKLLLLTVSIFVLFGISRSQSLNSIAQWRGVNRDGFYNETGLLAQWTEKGPELLWFTEEIGSGFAAPVIANDKVFINGEVGGTSYLFAFGLNGKLLWKSANGKEFMGDGYASNFPGARSTPTVMDNLVYTTSGNGRIACFETATGVQKWAVEMVGDLGGWLNDFGYSESVVVDSKNVYCFPGGTKTNVAALDRITGKTVWTSKAIGDTTSFCSPVLVKLPTREVLLTFGRHFLFTVDCADGKLLGSYPLKGFKYDGEHCNTPIYADGFVYVVVEDDEGEGAIKLALSPDGVITRKVWSNKQIKNGFGGFVVADNHLFTTIKGNWLKVLELANGAVSDSIKVANGSLILAGRNFISYGQNGEVNLIQYNQGKLAPSGKFKIDKGTKEHFSHPVVAGGVMYIRHGKALMAYKIK